MNYKLEIVHNDLRICIGIHWLHYGFDIELHRIETLKHLHDILVGKYNKNLVISD